jgi:uncharacterized protein (TIGR02391 family)
VPNAEDLLGLEPEELGLVLLESLKSYEQQQLQSYYGHPRNFLTSGEPVRGYPESHHARILNALPLAFKWLEREMLTVERACGNGWFEISAKGQKLDNISVQAYRHANTLPKHLLHPSIAKKVEAQFLRGEYDTAISTAFKQVEIAVRAAGRFSDSDIGKDLMRKAFDPDAGPLRSRSQVKAEREALAHLFAGAIGFCKNPTSHRQVDIEPVDVAQLLVLASHLLRIVEAHT